MSDDQQLKASIIKALKTVYDPEIPVNIYDLGLIYRLDVSSEGAVEIEMTLTAPGCPVAQTFPGYVEQVVRSVEGIGEVELMLVWEPPWSRERMSDLARMVLDMN